jgi:hypothetical protein
MFSVLIFRNLGAAMKGAKVKLPAEYDGYTSCPLVTGMQKRNSIWHCRGKYHPQLFG